MLKLIEFKGVSKVYEDTKTKALDNLDIRIENGEFVFIVGSSGAGKSTLLKLMMREEVPSSGSININGYSFAYSNKPCVTSASGTSYRLSQNESVVFVK